MFDMRIEPGAGKKAKALGWEGVCVISGKGVCEKLDVDVSCGFLIDAKAGKIRELARKNRKNFEVIAVKGGDIEVNRAAAESPEVDILLHPWGEREFRRDPGINHIVAKLAQKNNVSIEFNLGQLIESDGKARGIIFGHMVNVARLVRKFKTPFVLASGAKSEWEMRSPEELKAFGKSLGFSDPQIRKGLSGGIIKENRKRLAGKKWIMPGVEKL